MNFKRKELVVAIALMGISSASFAAEENNKKSAQLERVEIVGSNIKKIQKEGPNPVTVIKREEIEKTGATTVSELLRNMTANTGSSFDDSFTSGFAPGSSGVSLRGLGQDATLILLNGKRIANFGYAQNVSTSFVDLNSLPTGAIERVEILRDGASAIYGSDAVAGVINIITRKNYKGVETKITAGKSSRNDGQEVATNLTIGLGDYDEDGYNALVSIDTFDRDAIFARDRDISHTADQRWQGGRDLRSGTGTPGSYEDKNGKWKPILGCAAENMGANGRCLYDFNKILTLSPETQRRGALGVLNFKVTEDINAYTEFSINRNVTEGISAPTPITEGFISQNAAGVPDDAKDPANPDKKVKFAWRLVEAGNRLNKVISDSSRLVAGVKGSIQAWDWDLASGISTNKVSSQGKNYLNADLFEAAINDGSLNPFTSNSQAAIDAIKTNTIRQSKSKLSFVGLNVSNSELFNLPAGKIGAAFGLDYRKESVKDMPDILSSQGKIIGSGGTSANGKRSVSAVFAELNVPITKTLELQLAARRDLYNDFGGATNPKVAFRWQPTAELLFRGGYTTSFRAPSLAQSYLGDSTSFISLVDTKRCEELGECEYQQYKTTSAGNSKLDPETSKNWSFGFVFEPVKWASASLDIYRIDKKNSIDNNPQYILDNYEQYKDYIVRKTSGEIDSLRAPYLNLGSVLVQGADLDLSMKFNLMGGLLSLNNSLAYTKDYKVAEYPGADINQLAGGVNHPRFRNNLTVGWDKGTWSNTMVYRYIGRTKDSSTPYGGKRWIASDNVFDVQTVYSFGKKGTKLTVGIKNLFDTAPPFSTVGAPTEGYQIESYNARGRYFYTTLQHQFM